LFREPLIVRYSELKFKFKFKKRTGVFASLLAGASFIWLATARLGLPREKVVEWLGISFALLVILVLFAALLAFLLRWIMGRNEN